MNSTFTQEQTSFSQSQAQTPFYSTNVNGKKVIINFNGGNLTNDAGALILREIMHRLGIMKVLANIINDPRDPNKIKHSLEDLLKQRVIQIACGYEDANDSNELRYDPIFKILVNRDPIKGQPLASQPTFSRLENSIDKATNDKLEKELIDRFIDSYPDPPNVIVVDVDQTEDTAHGDQQESLFNGYYNEYCFMPLHIYEGLSGNLITTMLMPGKRPTGQEMLSITEPLIKKLRTAWPNTLIIFRGDSHFSNPEVHEWIDQQENVMFVTGLAGNSRLHKQAQPVINEAQKRYKDSKENVCRYHTLYYKAGSWSKMRRVVVKVEVTDKGTNVRYVVTDMENAKASDLYKIVYCGRGVAELYIKDHKTYLKSDRTSCHKYEANRFRLLLHSTAYILLHSLRKQLLSTTQWANVTMKTLQLKFLKVSARIHEFKTRIKVEICNSYPLKDIFRRCFQMMELILRN